MQDIKRVMEIKEGGKWVETFESTDVLDVYQSLAHDMIAKKINACTYIKSIKRMNNYDGTQQITVSYDNDSRCVYTVKE